MRRRFIAAGSLAILLLAGLTAATAAGNSALSPAASRVLAHRQEMLDRARQLIASQAPSAPTIRSAYNDGFTYQYRNHFGSNLQGLVRFGEYAQNNHNPAVEDAVPDQARPCAMVDLLYKVKRVSLDRVRLVDQVTGEVLAQTSAGINTNGATHGDLCGAAFDLTAADPNTGRGVLYDVEVDAHIRWADDTLSAVSYGSTVIINPNLLFAPA
jgi:hypothetical protein